MQVMLFFPELMLIITIGVLFLLSLSNQSKAILKVVAYGGSLLSIIAVLISFKQQGVLFYGVYKIDLFSQVFKLILTSGLWLIVCLGKDLKGIEEEFHSEYYFFLWTSVLGLVMLTSSVELLTILLCLELSSFALYIIIPFRKRGQYREQMEAGIKYILFGASATAITLYGMSYIFGLTHSTFLKDLSVTFPSMIQNENLILIGLILMLGGFFYKLALFPMHFWAPDVYEGASNETTAFIATLPKVAAVALIIRFLSLCSISTAQITTILATFAILSMTIGNLSALVQQDIKRLLAYSSIAHAGYVLIGLFCMAEGMSAGIYYITGYLLMNIACFYVVYHIGTAEKNVTIDDLNGLYKRSPLLAFTLAIGAFGLAGIPPTIGFTGKLLIFTAAIQKGFYGLVVIAVINAGISAFYYLRLVRAAYFGVEQTLIPFRLSFSTRCIALLIIFGILLTGIFPQVMVETMNRAIQMIM
ncbi:MAG: NADH-quinone oxidoreductase subunit N [Desulfobacterales bacterium]|nr:NADH-quinone oxidoreductase subunit N [Desulfobacterales bacterium]